MLDLAGTWNFSYEANNGSSKSTLGTIAVPGEYLLQGYSVPALSTVVYERDFDIPADWLAETGSTRVKLQCHGVYSQAQVVINGKAAGSHLGGFTAWELDITAAIARHNQIQISVVGMDTLADSLAAGSQYAGHDIGGITRKIRLIAVPTINIADIYVQTSVSDGSPVVGTVSVQMLLSNDAVGSNGALWPFEQLLHTHETESVTVALTPALSIAGAKPVATATLEFSGLAPGSAKSQTVNLTVQQPQLWDPEHPRLYSLQATTSSGSTVIRMIGIREVSVVGNTVFVNHQPIKARGATRHETHPVYGRALAASLYQENVSLWEEDLKLLRDLNINYVRTSHYPPAEEFVEAADRLGMFIELEMPFCWARGNIGQDSLDYTIQAQLESVVQFRSHPSVIVWSLGNESPWSPSTPSNFNVSLQHYVKRLDLTRPFLFDGGSGDEHDVDIWTVHYPGLRFNATTYQQNPKPTLFGEYMAVTCYNRREIWTDPGGVRDAWGFGVQKMWEKVWHSEGVFGGNIWAFFDDFFYTPGGQIVGYGYWGIVDSWRRPHPEAVVVQNVLAPVVLADHGLNGCWSVRDGTLQLLFENRFDFSDLSEVNFTWRVINTDTTGRGHVVGVAPARSTAVPVLLHGLGAEMRAGVVEVNATSPRGFRINTWWIDLPASQASGSKSTRGAMQGVDASDAGADATGTTDRVGGPSAAAVEPIADGSSLVVSTAAGSWRVDSNGVLTGQTSAGKVVQSGPHLTVIDRHVEGVSQIQSPVEPTLPLTDHLPGWQATSVVHQPKRGVIVNGTYAGLAHGSYVFSFTDDGHTKIAYSFVWVSNRTLTPRQVGLAFALPRELELLSWQRNGQFSFYPPDQTSRLTGADVPANADPSVVAGRWTTKEHAQAWKDDSTSLGSADFRSTRLNFTWFSLAANATAADARGLHAFSDGDQHARAWVDDTAGAACIRMLVADVTNEGAQPSLVGEWARVLWTPTVSQGVFLQGEVRLALSK